MHSNKVGRLNAAMCLMCVSLLLCKYKLAVKLVILESKHLNILKEGVSGMELLLNHYLSNERIENYRNYFSIVTKRVD